MLSDDQICFYYNTHSHICGTCLMRDLIIFEKLTRSSQLFFIFLRLVLFLFSQKGTASHYILLQCKFSSFYIFIIIQICYGDLINRSQAKTSTTIVLAVLILVHEIYFGSLHDKKYRNEFFPCGYGSIFIFKWIFFPHYCIYRPRSVMDNCTILHNVWSWYLVHCCLGRSFSLIG